MCIRVRTTFLFASIISSAGKVFSGIPKCIADPTIKGKRKKKNKTLLSDVYATLNCNCNKHFFPWVDVDFIHSKVCEWICPGNGPPSTHAC